MLTGSVCGYEMKASIVADDAKTVSAGDRTRILP
jgi:hypothetical protein